MDLHDILEAGKAKIVTTSSDDINFDLIVHEVKDDLFKTHIKNVGKQRINEKELIATSEYDKQKNKDMKVTERNTSSLRIHTLFDW